VHNISTIFQVLRGISAREFYRIGFVHWAAQLERAKATFPVWHFRIDGRCLSVSKHLLATWGSLDISLGGSPAAQEEDAEYGQTDEG
jgi:hypothetical protein